MPNPTPPDPKSTDQSQSFTDNPSLYGLYADPENQERRFFPRVAIDSLIELRLDSVSTPITGQCADISSGGMLIRIDEALETGESVQLTLIDPQSLSRLFSANVQVARVESLAKGGYLIGVIMAHTH